MRLWLMVMLLLQLLIPVRPAAAEAAAMPTGAWRTTNECFLAAFILTENNVALVVYASGEQDDMAAWSWNGSTLSIISKMYDKDSFAAHVTGSGLQAEYIWHEKDTDTLHPQMCSFESFTPLTL